MSDLYGVGYDEYDDPFGEGLLDGYDAFSSPGSQYDIAYDDFAPMGVGYLDDDQLVAAKRRIDLLKAIMGMQFDSRLGYYGAVEQGSPTFNFPGLTAGSGVEQAGTAEAGSPAEGDIIGFDMQGEPIMSAGGGSSSGGGGGGSGGRSGGMDPVAANRFLQGLGMAEGSTGVIFQGILEDAQNSVNPAVSKAQIREQFGDTLDPDQLKLMLDTVDQAWEASGVTTAAAEGKLPKSSDLGVQVGKWGTVDPTKAYTPDTLPEDILGQLGPDYLEDLDKSQRAYDMANEGWNRYLKNIKGQDAFQVWKPQPELTMEDAIGQTAGGGRGGGGEPGAAGAFAQPGQPAAVNPNNLNADQAYTINSPEDADRLYGTGGGPAAINPNNLDVDAVSITDPASANAAIGRAAAGETPVQDPTRGNPAVQSLIQGVLAAANRERGQNTPFATDKSGGLLNYTLDLDQDEAKELGLSGFDTFQMVPGGKRKVYTSEEGAKQVRQRRTTKANYERDTKSNAILRAAIARDLAMRGRTPQRDDMRNRQNQLRNMLGI
jgi:hypothetical protein